MSVSVKASSLPRNGQVRILQIVESLHTGAVENWLYRVFSAVSANYSDYHWTFFCTSGKPGRLDEKVRGLGGEIIYSRYTIGEKRAFFSSLRKVIKEGHYDILHCHHDLVSAIYLCASLGIPLRKRIVHVHNTDEGILTPSRLKQFLLKEPMRQTCMHFADNIVGISKEALNKFIRGARPKPGRDQVVYYGIDTSVFRQNIPTPEQFRLSLGFSSDAKILLFVGRMVPLKNPCFVVDVLAALANRDPSVVAVFVGAGDLETTVRELAEQKQLQERVRILGWRDDTATIMRLCDLLVFPRLEEPKEGLGLVLVEGQAAGLPILASPSITKDVQVIPELFEIIPLAAGPEAWAERIHAMLSQKRLPRQRYLKRVEASSFSIIAGISNLLALYSDQN
jgi:glycosyltransferase involved in cell wall biosynthesis